MGILHIILAPENAAKKQPPSKHPTHQFIHFPSLVPNKTRPTQSRNYYFTIK